MRLFNVQLKFFVEHRIVEKVFDDFCSVPVLTDLARDDVLVFT